jgi:hypothetical protein
VSSDKALDEFPLQRRQSHPFRVTRKLFGDVHDDRQFVPFRPDEVNGGFAGAPPFGVIQNTVAPDDQLQVGRDGVLLDDKIVHDAVTLLESVWCAGKV